MISDKLNITHNENPPTISHPYNIVTLAPSINEIHNVDDNPNGTPIKENPNPMTDVTVNLRSKSCLYLKCSTCSIVSRILLLPLPLPSPPSLSPSLLASSINDPIYRIGASDPISFSICDA